MTDQRHWMATAPTEAGLYHFACEESDGVWEVVQVDSWLCLRRRSGEAWTGDHIGLRTGLYVDCPNLGILPLAAYHDGQTSPRWRMVEPLALEQTEGAV
jgi:hypothetical protein